MRICVFYSVLVVLHFKIYHIVAFKDLSTGHTFSLKFFKRKKEKKESRIFKWKVSKKQVFRIKYYPYASVETLSRCGGIENVRVEILSGTEGLNLLF